MATQQGELERLTISNSEEDVEYNLNLQPNIAAFFRGDAVIAGTLYNLLTQRYGKQNPKGKTLNFVRGISETREIAKEFGFGDVLDSQVPGLPLRIDCESPAVDDLMETESQDMSQLSPTAPSEGSEKVNWSNRAVLLLVESYRSHSHLFQSSVISKKQVWRKICNDLQAKGLVYTADDCERKFRSLKRRYRLIKDRHGKTGHGRITWQYYDLMDELLAGDHSVTPIASVSSLAPAALRSQMTSPTPATTHRLQTTTPSTPVSTFISPAAVSLSRNPTNTPILTSPVTVQPDDFTADLEPVLPSPSASLLAPHPTPTTPAPKRRGRKRRHPSSDLLEVIEKNMKDLKEMEQQRMRREDERWERMEAQESRRLDLLEELVRLMKQTVAPQ